MEPMYINPTLILSFEGFAPVAETETAADPASFFVHAKKETASPKTKASANNFFILTLLQI
jgi:hypothetical protein